MIIVTGAAGFIASCLVKELNNQGYKDIVIVDDFTIESKKRNWSDLIYSYKIERLDFFDWLKGKESEIQFIFHLGARTNTAEQDQVLLKELNLNYSKEIWETCCAEGIPLIYASSAATYGDGALGFDDNTQELDSLVPLNFYGESKNDFDKWAFAQKKKPSFWAGFKFFNVYGPNEYHKSRMASVIWHAFHQIKSTKGMKLFRSHNPEYKDGEQQRDFVYVKDVVQILLYFMETRKNSGLYNLGTGTPRTFLDLTKAVFHNLGLEPNISFIDTPEDIREKYQYYTCANMQKLRNAGYDKGFTSLEEGVEDYVKNYLIPDKNY